MTARDVALRTEGNSVSNAISGVEVDKAMESVDGRANESTGPDGLALSIAAANTRELLGPNAERRVWENQRHREHPLAVGYEAKYTRAFHNWSRQFYPATSLATATGAGRGRTL